MANIELYTRPGCAFCESAKRLLQTKGVEYQEYNVGRDQARFEEMRARTSNKTFPQIFIDGENIGGFTELLSVKL